MELTYLPDWFREASIDPSTINLDARKTSIEAIAGAAKVADVPPIVRLAHGSDARAFRDTVIDAIREEDAAFPARENDLEVRLMAAAAAIAILEEFDSDEVSDALALAVMQATRLDWLPSIGDLPTAATNYLERRSEAHHALPARISPPRPTDLNKVVKDWDDHVVAAGDLATGASAAFRALAGQIDSHSKYVRDTISSQQRRLAIALQELDLLWWFEAGWSTYANGPWSEVNKAAIPIVLGAEFAGWVTELPGPANFTALQRAALRRLGLKLSDRSLEAAVAGLRPHETEKIMQRASQLSGVEDLCPIHASVQAATETDDGAWVSIARKRTGVALDRPLDALEITARTYLEALLLRSLEKQQ